MSLRFPTIPGNPSPHRMALAVAALCALAGCTATPTRQEMPRVPLPTQFRQQVDPAPADAGTKGATPAAQLDPRQLREWWKQLGDPQLDALVDRTLANNTDLHIATARIEQAAAHAHQADALRAPVVGLSYDAIAQKPDTYTVGTPNTAGTSTYHVLQLSTSLDLDLWGARKSAAESAELQLERMSFAREDTRRTLVANAVGLYIDVLSLNDRVRIAHETATVLDGMLSSVRARMDGGEATATDYEQQRAAVHAVLATIPVLELQRENAINALAFLMGVPPSALDLPADRGLDALHFPELRAGVPADLLLNRPDVHAAEAHLRSAHADIAAARARLLPTVGLTGQAGYGSEWLSSLVTPAGFYWNVVASISATLFDAGARQDDVDFARAVHEELVEGYVQTLYGAIRETEDALAAVHYNSARLADQDIACEAARNAWKNSIDTYGAGAIDFLTLLDTERTYYNHLDTLQGVRRDRYKGLVSLFAALGGGVNLGSDETPGSTADAGADDEPVALQSSTTTARHDDGQAADDGRYVVAIAGLQDGDGVRRVGRDLEQRFAGSLEDHRVVARLYGKLGHRGARIHWYRVFVTGFAGEDEATSFCSALSAQMQRCEVLPSNDAAFTKGSRRVVR